MAESRSNAVIRGINLLHEVAEDQRTTYVGGSDLMAVSYYIGRMERRVEQLEGLLRSRPTLWSELRRRIRTWFEVRA